MIPTIILFVLMLSFLVAFYLCLKNDNREFPALITVLVGATTVIYLILYMTNEMYDITPERLAYERRLELAKEKTLRAKVLSTKQMKTILRGCGKEYVE